MRSCCSVFLEPDKRVNGIPKGSEPHKSMFRIFEEAGKSSCRFVLLISPGRGNPEFMVETFGDGSQQFLGLSDT